MPPRRTRGWWLLAAAFATAPGGRAALDQAVPPEPGAERAMRVVDGDTPVVRTGGRRVTVRRLGIDTPETHAETTECGALAAGRRLARLAPAGVPVRLTGDPRSGDTHDRYARLLAFVDSPAATSATARGAPPSRMSTATAAALLAARPLPARAGPRARRPPGRLVGLRGRLPLRATRPPTPLNAVTLRRGHTPCRTDAGSRQGDNGLANDHAGRHWPGRGAPRLLPDAAAA
jgi:hypothetical protein